MYHNDSIKIDLKKDIHLNYYAKLLLLLFWHFIILAENKLTIAHCFTLNKFVKNDLSYCSQTYILPCKFLENTPRNAVLKDL